MRGQLSDLWARDLLQIVFGAVLPTLAAAALGPGAWARSLSPVTAGRDHRGQDKSRGSTPHLGFAVRFPSAQPARYQRQRRRTLVRTSSVMSRRMDQCMAMRAGRVLIAALVSIVLSAAANAAEYQHLNARTNP